MKLQPIPQNGKTLTVVPQDVQPERSTLDSMIHAGIAQKASIADLKELYALKKEWEAEEARKAYNSAIADFKANPPTIMKDKQNKQYDSWYTSLANLVNRGNEAMAPFGLNARWDLDQSKAPTITVGCILSHVKGHSERVTMSAPADTSGQKNPIQQIKSTITYLRGVTFEMVTGLASTEHNADDDGNGSGKDAPPDPNQAWIDATHTIEDSVGYEKLLKEAGEAFGCKSKVPQKVKVAFGAAKQRSNHGSVR